MADFYVCSLHTIFRCSVVVVGSVKAPHFSLIETFHDQGQPHQAARGLTSGRLTTVAEHNWETSLFHMQKTIVLKRS